MAEKAINQSVTVSKIERATVKMTNMENPDRRYDIAAEFDVTGFTANNVNNGTVRQIGKNEGNSGTEGANVATFNAWGDSSRSISFQNVPDIEKSKEILSDVLQFITDCKDSIKKGGIIN